MYRLRFGLLLKLKNWLWWANEAFLIYVFCFKDTKNLAALLFFLAASNKKFQRANATYIAREGSDPPDDWLKTGWARDSHGSWILLSLSSVRSKTMHFLSCITSWLPNITLCYIDSRFFLPLEQSRAALLGCRLPASRLREAARWQS